MDFFKGREFNPSLMGNDLKLQTYRYSMIGLALLNVLLVVDSVNAKKGEVNPAVLVSAALQVILTENHYLNLLVNHSGNGCVNFRKLNVAIKFFTLLKSFWKLTTATIFLMLTLLFMLIQVFYAMDAMFFEETYFFSHDAVNSGFGFSLVSAYFSFPFLPTLVTRYNIAKK